MVQFLWVGKSGEVGVKVVVGMTKGGADWIGWMWPQCMKESD